jgi:hypothetical protein
MIVALDFYVRSLNLRDNLPVPCSFCLESTLGDRKVVTLNAAYRHPELVAVRHWLLSDCLREQSLPALNEKLIPRESIFEHEFVIVPQHQIMGFVSPYIVSSLNFSDKPMPQDQFSMLYDGILRTDVHTVYKEAWIFREFTKVYLPFMIDMLFEGESRSVDKWRELMAAVMTAQPELWHKWLHWRKYMIDFQGIPGEIAFCREYGQSVFSF